MFGNKRDREEDDGDRRQIIVYNTNTMGAVILGIVAITLLRELIKVQSRMRRNDIAVPADSGRSVQRGEPLVRAG